MFLNRDQTNEWRGWMQLVILLYHYIGASKVMIVIGSDSVDGFTHYFFLKWTKDTLHNRVRNDLPVASLPRVSRAFMHVVRFTLKYAVICAFRHASLAHTCLSPALLRGARTHACVSRTPPQWIRCKVTFFSPRVSRVSMCFSCDCMCVSRSSIRCKVTYLSSCLSLLAYAF